ncbi:hypothetical protein L208DRAFT_1378060 [Tricholoma matsutake]|nr:hypothetical protein L208DRAFT_1378060 [Tricholoma matsutake 945]
MLMRILVWSNVQAYREAKAAAKEKTAANKRANIQKVAEFKGKSQQKATAADLHGNNPTDKPTVAKGKRARMAESTVMEFTNSNEDITGEPVDPQAPENISTTQGDGRDPEEPSSATNAEDETTEKESPCTLPEESEPSGSEYSDDEEDEDDEDNDRELADDEPDTSVKPKCGGKREKKGHAAREIISARVAAIITDEQPHPNVEAVKCKVGSHPEAMPSIQTASLHASSEVNDIAAFSFDSIPLDDEMIKENHAGTQKGYDKYKVIYLLSVAKIKDVHSAPLKHIDLTNPPTSVRKIKTISNANLPDGTQHLFTKVVGLITCKTTGALEPWETPDYDELIEIWNLVFGNDHPIRNGNFKCEVFITAKTLMKHSILAWLHKFKDAAEDAVSEEFKRQGLKTDAAKAEFVHFLLGDLNNISSKNHPFIWESIYDDPKAERQGIFQGQLFAQTFLEHLVAISGIPEDYHVQECPVGALVLSIQAEPQWDNIYAKAWEQAKHSRWDEKKEAEEDYEVPEESDDDQELFNPKYDAVQCDED